MTGETGALTQGLVAKAWRVNDASLPDRALTIARQCLLDYVGVSLAGANEPAVRILFEELEDAQTTQGSLVMGHSCRLPPFLAALVNGTAAHALDFDDVNMAMPGHPTVAIMPAVLALGEKLGASSGELLTAFVRGYGFACDVGNIMGPGHYDAGFHPTATLGSMGAAVASASLLGLDQTQAVRAVSIAATQAAGLKSQFGTMCKPLHAGKAAQNGVFSAGLASRSFSAHSGIIETRQGFASTHGPDFHPESSCEPTNPADWLSGNLFKYHAACYLTHPAIEAALKLSCQSDFDAGLVSTVRVTMGEMAEKVCNIPEPRNGLEIKFSLRATTAMALTSVDTASLGSYSMKTLDDPQFTAMMPKIAVAFEHCLGSNEARVEIALSDGAKLAAVHDSGVPADNLKEQGQKLRRKFLALLNPIVGTECATDLHETIMRLGQPDSLQRLYGLLAVDNRIG